MRFLLTLKVGVLLLLLGSSVAQSTTSSSTPAPSIPPISHNRTLTIINNCSFAVFPAIFTQNGTGPYTGGFHLDSKASRDIWVGAEWAGRIWSRTNCSFAIQNTTSGDIISN